MPLNLPDVAAANPKRDFTYFVLWLAATIILGLIGAHLLGVYEFYRLTYQGVQAEGVIYELDFKNHNAVLYNYKVGENTYSGGGFAGNIKADIGSLHTGQKVTIFYDPDNPEVSCLGDPDGKFSSSLSGTAFIGAIPTFFILSLIIRRIMKAPDSYYQRK
ncbi:MAG TPA: DUF3592 domain-containing protein [Pyrinomonadaceae bacterium]|jgi:hypothetical protein